MKSRHVVRTTRPMQGLVAFARAAVMGSLGACGAARRQVFPTSSDRLERNEGRVHPGEGSA